MKKLLFFSLLSLLISCVAWGQNTVITYNVANGRIEGLRPVREGNCIILTINNVNRFRYDVKVSGKNIDYSTPVPNELATVFRLTAPGNGPTVEETQQAAEEMAAAAVAVDSAAVGNNTLEPLQRACSTLATHARQIAGYKFLRMQLIALSKQDFSNHTELTDKLRLLSTIPDIAEMQNAYTEFLQSYAQAELEYARLAVDPAIREIYDHVHDAFDIFHQDKFYKIFEDIISLSTALEDAETYFTYVSAPIQVRGDFVLIEVTIAPKPTNALIPSSNARTVVIEIPAKLGWKADFSVGPLMSWGDGANDHSFYLDSIDNTNTGTLQQYSQRNAVRPAIAAMIHVGPRALLGRYASASFMMGVGANFKSISDPDVSLYFGGSLVLGKRSKTMLSVGVGFLRVARLKEQEYTVGDILPLTMRGASFTDPLFRASPFFSFSYNIATVSDVN